MIYDSYLLAENSVRRKKFFDMSLVVYDVYGLGIPWASFKHFGAFFCIFWASFRIP